MQSARPCAAPSITHKHIHRKRGCCNENRSHQNMLCNKHNHTTTESCVHFRTLHEITTMEDAKGGQATHTHTHTHTVAAPQRGRDDERAHTNIGYKHPPFRDPAASPYADPPPTMSHWYWYSTHDCAQQFTIHTHAALSGDEKHAAVQRGGWGAATRIRRTQRRLDAHDAHAHARAHFAPAFNTRQRAAIHCHG